MLLGKATGTLPSVTTGVGSGSKTLPPPDVVLSRPAALGMLPSERSLCVSSHGGGASSDRMVITLSGIDRVVNALPCEA